MVELKNKVIYDGELKQDLHVMQIAIYVYVIYVKLDRVGLAFSGCPYNPFI